MTHGAPDFYQYRKDSVSFPVADLAELAVRLGSINVFDQRGDVIFLEAFEHGLGRWLKSLYGDNAAIIVDATVWKTGGYSTRMTPGTTGAVGAELTAAMYYPRTTKIGLEVSFATEKVFDEIHARVYLYTGTAAQEFHFRYDLTNKTLDVLDSVLGWTTVASDVAFAQTVQNWHTMKVVADLATLQYTRIIFDNAEYDVSQYSFVTAASSARSSMRASILVLGTGSANLHVYVDDIILTQSEP